MYMYMHTCMHTHKDVRVLCAICPSTGKETVLEWGMGKSFVPHEPRFPLL